MSILMLHKARVLYDDERGWVVDPIIQGDFAGAPPQNIHLVSAEPGAVRGNHYHERQHEFLCIFGARARVAVYDPRGERREEQELSGQEPMILDARPGLAHAVKNVGEGLLYLLCYADREFDRDRPDLVRMRILD